MSSSLLTPSVIAKEGLMQLDNNLVAAKKVYRAYEGEFGDTKIGDTVTIRKPVKYAIRTGAVASMQDATEGKTTIQINTQQGVDLRFPTKDLTLTIDKFAERYLMHPMIALANQVDLNILALSKNVWNYVTPAQVAPDATKVLASYGDLTTAFRRLDDLSVPTPRTALISPGDFYGITGNITGVFNEKIVGDALTRSRLPMLGNVDVFATQNLRNGSAPLLANAASLTVSNTSQTLSAVYDGSANSVKDTNAFSLLLTGFDASATLYQGNVFTIAGVYAINPVTKQALPYLQQFVINADVVTNATPSADTTVTFSPAPVIAGPYQNVSAAPAAGAVVKVFGATAGYTNVAQNMVFHENAFALCMVPMELPEGAVKKARESYKGLSMRIICDYDIINDINMWRIDILYGVKAIYPDLACRLNGATAGK